MYRTDIVEHICGQQGNHFYKSLRDLAIYVHGEQIHIVRGQIDDSTAEYMLTMIRHPLSLEHGLDYCHMFIRVVLAHELFKYLVTGEYDVYTVHMCSILAKRCWQLSRQQNLLTF